MSNTAEFKNTDCELWRGPDDGRGSYYADSIHVTEGGGIGIDVGGHVIVKPLRDWHRLAAADIGTVALATRNAALRRAAEVLGAISKFVRANIPSTGLNAGKVTLSLGYEGAEMIWVARDSYEEAAFNELGGLVGIGWAAKEQAAAALEAKMPDRLPGVGECTDDMAHAMSHLDGYDHDRDMPTLQHWKDYWDAAVGALGAANLAKIRGEVITDENGNWIEIRPSPSVPNGEL